MKGIIIRIIVGALSLFGFFSIHKTVGYVLESGLLSTIEHYAIMFYMAFLVLFGLGLLGDVVMRIIGWELEL